MKIAVTAMGDSLDDSLAFRLGRSAYYLIIDLANMEVEPIETPDRLGGEEEVSALCLQLMVDRQVSMVVTGHCGPEAHKAFGQAGIQVIPGMAGTVEDVVEQLQGRFTQTEPDTKIEDVPAEHSVVVFDEAPGKESVRRMVPYEDFLQVKAPGGGHAAQTAGTTAAYTQAGEAR